MFASNGFNFAGAVVDVAGFVTGLGTGCCAYCAWMAASKGLFFMVLCRAGAVLVGC